MIRTASIFFLLVVLSIGANAAGLSASYTDWVVNGKVVRLSVTLPRSIANNIAPPDDRTPAQTIEKYVSTHVAVSSAAGECQQADQGYDIGTVDILAATPSAYRFEVFFDCPGAVGIVLNNNLLFAENPAHVDFARIRIGAQKAVQMLFRQNRRSIALQPDGAMIAGSSVMEYVPAGLAHAVSSWICLVFFVALCIIVRKKKDTIYCVAALILGFGASALIALTERIAPDVVSADAFCGICLLLVVIQTTVTRTGKSIPIAFASLLLATALAVIPILELRWAIVLTILGAGLMSASYAVAVEHFQNADALRVAPVLLFGFFDGTSLSPAVTSMHPSLRTAVPILAGIDFGAWLADATVLLLLFCLFGTVFQARARITPLFQDLAMATLSGVGLFWVSSAFWW